MTNKKRLVVKDNALINASYNLDLTEQRLILLAIVEARQNDTPMEAELVVHAEKYIDAFGVSRQTAYKVLSDACASLFERRFSYERLSAKGNVERVMSRWVQRVVYIDNEATVRIKFSDDVVPLIRNLEKRFTSYYLEQISELSSAYAVRLYELLIAWRNTCKTPVLEIDDFRAQLGLEPSEYKTMSNFKSRVLDAAIEQINQHTDITVKYEQYKRGRRISGFSFFFEFKHPKLEPKGRLTITKAQAQEKARLGEGWHELYKRLSADFIISD